MSAWFTEPALDFTNNDVKTAEGLLQTGYPMNMAALQLAEDSGLSLASLNQMAPIEFLIREIMKKAALAGRLDQLLAAVLYDPAREGIHADLWATLAGHEPEVDRAAYNRKPSVATLAALPLSMRLRPPGDAAPRDLTDRAVYEAMQNEAAGFLDINVFRTRLAEAEVRTARIDIGGKAKGTGFLVADDLVLTNWHVVKNGVDGAVARFDHKVVGATEFDGRTVSFVDDWKVAWSPIDRLDFALVRLSEPAGAQALGTNPDDDEAERRGSYGLNGDPYAYDSDEPVLIVGHPEGGPMQLSYASPSGVKRSDGGNRILYDTNTEPGSSGSPVFNKDWRVIGLHHAAETGANRGIPIEALMEEFKAQLDAPVLEQLGIDH